jgi:5,10-methylene-tetrahydrofolate dehydrogenase/methenyl tetrahydrofolate cyclohydrolase
MCGDCYSLLGKENDLVSPVPGGVGLLTRVALLENVVKAYEYR